MGPRHRAALRGIEASRAPSHERARHGGFTMVELIVVMLLMGILAAVAAPRLIGRSALEERGFQDALQSMLRHSRALAMAQQRDVCVLLNAAQASVVYTSAGLCDPAAPAAQPGNVGNFVLVVPTGVALGGVGQVRFNPLGQPVPNANQAVTVGALAFTVSRETGIVY